MWYLAPYVGTFPIVPAPAIGNIHVRACYPWASSFLQRGCSISSFTYVQRYLRYRRNLNNNVEYPSGEPSVRNSFFTTLSSAFLTSNQKKIRKGREVYEESKVKLSMGGCSKDFGEGSNRGG
jgi:hypothetical protein